MKTWGSGGITPPLLTLALNGGEWSASHLSHFTVRVKCPWYLLDRKLDGPQSWSGHYGVEKISFPSRESKPSHQTHNLSLYRLSYPGSLFGAVGCFF
jgi:hypothetical protein